VIFLNINSFTPFPELPLIQKCFKGILSDKRQICGACNSCFQKAGKLRLCLSCSLSQGGASFIRLPWAVSGRTFGACRAPNWALSSSPVRVAEQCEDTEHWGKERN